MKFQPNSTFLFTLAGLVILFVIAQSIFFLVRAYRRGKSLGIETAQMKKTILSTAVFTLAPAVSILLGVITLSKFLGLPLPWLRLSVIGAITYELPAALTAMENARVKPGTEKGEVISTIAVATSSIVTTIVIALGVALLVPLTPILNNPAVKPAFDNILPSLFGGLAVVYVSKNWKISVAPLLFMVILFLLVPSLSGSVGVLVPVGALIAIGSARFLYKNGKL